MIIHFTLNGAPQELTVNPGENVQKLLFNMGMHSVRNSDDGFGFAGSDAIIFNGNIVNASPYCRTVRRQIFVPQNLWANGTS